MSIGDLLIHLRIYIFSVGATKIVPILRFGLGFFAVFLLLRGLGFMKHRGVFPYLRVREILLIFEISLIVAVTLWGRTPKDVVVWDWKPLVSYVRVLQGKSMGLLAQIILNIIIFIPMGILLPWCLKVCERYRYTLAIVFFISISIEVLQGVTQIGSFEIDDVINNLMGTGIGVMLYHVFVRRKKG